MNGEKFSLQNKRCLSKDLGDSVCSVSYWTK